MNVTFKGRDTGWRPVFESREGYLITLFTALFLTALRPSQYPTKRSPRGVNQGGQSVKLTSGVEA